MQDSQLSPTVYRTASWVPMVPTMEGFHCIQDSQLGPSGAHYREVPLYAGQPAGSQWCPLWRGSTVCRTASWVPVVPTIERFHCIQDSQLSPSGAHYREVPLYTGQPAGSQWCPLWRGSIVYSLPYFRNNEMQSAIQHHVVAQHAMSSVDRHLPP